MTYEELKARLEKVQQAILTIQASTYEPTRIEGAKHLEKQLVQLQESLQNRLKLILEMDKGVIHTDDENKAKDLAQQGVQVQLHKKGEPLDTKKIKEAEEGLQFDENQTKEIAKEVAKAVAMALKEDGMQIASAKIIRLEAMAFDTYFQYKDGKEDEFSFHIDQDRNIILSDFTFSEKIGEVGLKGAGTPHVNADVIKANLLKVWAKLDGNMQEDAYDPTQIYGKKDEPQGDLMQQLEQALKSHDWYYMMSDDHRYYTRGSEQARNIHNLITKLKEAGQGEEAEALYKSYHEKNRISEASAGSIQKKHGELVAKMKALAAQYKGGDQSVIPQLKAMTAEKKKLEAELDAAVAGTGADQELDSSVNEYEHHYRLVGGECRKYNDEGDYSVVSMSYCRYNEGKDYDKDGKVEKPEQEYKGVKDKAIKKATGKTEAKKAKKDFDKDGDVESAEAEYKGVKDKAVKKAMLKEDWGSSDQGIMNKAIHADLGEPEDMPMPFDTKFESAVESAVDFYWDEWEEYKTDRDGLIDHAKRAYYRRYFPEKFAGFQKMFSEAATQTYADLETIANDTANMPADRDAARNKMYDLKKKKPGTKLAEAQDLQVGDTVAKKFASTDEDNVREFSIKAIKNGKAEVEDLKTKKVTTISLSDLYKVGKAVNEAPKGTYYITVSVRDARRALEIIHDNPAYRKAVEMDGSDTYYLTDPELAYDLQMDFGTQNIEVTDTNVDMDEAKGETELVQDPKTKEFTRKMKMTPKDMDTITKVQDMMAKEKSMKKEGEGDETAVDITGKAYSVGDIIDFRGQMFQAVIGAGGRVMLAHLDSSLQQYGKNFEGGTPQFMAVLKNGKIVSDKGGISEGGVNPEGDAMVLNFVKKLAKIWDIPMQHAVNFIHASIKRQGY